MLDRKKRPTQAEAELAIQTLIDYMGDNPTRDGVIDTPARVIRAYKEWFSGYAQDPVEFLNKTFENASGYQDMVLLKDIDIVSTCEHHMAPIIGKAHIAYIPKDRIVGLSKLVRVVDAHARRLQVQERLTHEIAQSIEEGLNPLGVAVIIEAEHFCMKTRGVHRNGVQTITRSLKGKFSEKPHSDALFALLRS